MKTIGIVTFHRHDNYGAVLQCYALQQTLKKMGFEPSVIDYRCKVDEYPCSLEAIKSRGLLHCLMSVVGKISRFPRHSKFKKFRQKLNLTKTLDKKDLYQIENCFDCYIAGSDNIWNANITGLDSTYFLDFVNDKRKRNTYAVSFGSDVIPQNMEESYRNFLSGIHTFLLREKSGLEIVDRIIGRKGSCVLDPTLLLDGEEWGQMARQNSIMGKYVLAYQLVPSRFFLHKAHELAKQLHCKLIVVPFAQGAFTRCQNKFGYGPEEWLSSIKNAEYIITDSFHGCVFSILFHKQFNVVVSQLGTRIYSLLDLFNLKNKIIVKDNEYIDMSEIDYDKIDSILAEEKTRSLNYLRDMIEGI